jgi:nucleotide-binding universal stress UspA family protein
MMALSPVRVSSRSGEKLRGRSKANFEASSPQGTICGGTHVALVWYTVDVITLQRILIPHDLSEPAMVAMSFGAVLARTFGAACDVLHVTTVAEIDQASAQRDGILETAVHQQLGPSGCGAGVDPEFQYRHGVPHDAIVRYARDRNIDLIVMGTHGRGALAHAVLGSVAEMVVRNAPCPVLTVRSQQRDFLVRKILVPTDFEAASEIALINGRTLARIFGATLHVLHVMENSFMRAVVADPHGLADRARQRLHDQLTDDDRRVLHATVALEVSDNPAQAIVDYASNTSIDLIVMGTHGRQAMDRLLMGSVAERVVRTSPCPVLTARCPERSSASPKGSLPFRDMANSRAGHEVG